MTKSLKITETLYLVEQPIKTKKAISIEPSNRILIFDESGSMASVYKSMIQDAIHQVDAMPATDTLSIGWFSSKGEFGWIVKGMSLSNKKAIQAILEQHKPKFNLTCFSQIFADTETVINDLKPLSQNNSLLFLTDGDDNQEEKKVLDTLGKIAPSLRLATVIGYGDWYNRKRLADISKILGASFVHASNLKEFKASLTAFNNAASAAEPKITVKPQAQPLWQLGFTLTNDAVEVVEDTDAEMLVCSGADALYYFHEKPVGQIRDLPPGPIYGATKTLLQNDKIAEAIDLQGMFGDVRFVNAINNAFTVAEYGQVEADLTQATYHENARFTSGQQPGCVPTADAFCVLDLLDALMADDQVSFLPYHPDFEYKKVGRSSKQKEGYPKFETAKDVQVGLRNLVYSSDKLNISIRCQITGTITLDQRAAELKLSRLFSAYIWRNYTIVSDGKLNVTRLPLKNVPADMMDKLNRLGLVESDNGTTIVNLTKLPVINRAIAEGYRDLDALCSLVWREKQLEVANKVYGHCFKTLPEDLQDRVDSLVRDISYTSDQLDYLASFGIKKDGSFAPPTEEQKATDRLYVTEIGIDVKGMASIPKIEDALGKITDALTAGKELSPMQAVIHAANQAYITTHDSSSDKAKALWLREQLQTNRRELARVRAQINRTRFAVIVGKTPFTQLPKLQEQTTYELNNTTFTLKVKRDVEIPI